MQAAAYLIGLILGTTCILLLMRFWIRQTVTEAGAATEMEKTGLIERLQDREQSLDEITFDLDHAMRIHLGGNPNSGAIQIGMGIERLNDAFGLSAPAIQKQLDTVLDTALKRAVDRFAAGESFAAWLATELPSLSEVCRRKIEGHVRYRLVN